MLIIGGQNKRQLTVLHVFLIVFCTREVQYARMDSDVHKQVARAAVLHSIGDFNCPTTLSESRRWSRKLLVCLVVVLPPPCRRMSRDGLSDTGLVIYPSPNSSDIQLV